jgi:GR25 family glycosyltransferase involved in LPS biosynthesis
MRQLTPIIILTLKNSLRERIIVKRLKYLRLRFKIIYGIEAKYNKNHKILIKNYNKKKSEISANRKLSYGDIACAYGHLKIYKYIVKNKIPSAIIMEDDAWPSKYFKRWLKCDLKDFDIIQFISPFGFVKKKPYLKKNNFRIHNALTKLATTTCYQINLKTAAYILKFTDGKVCNVADWPIQFSNGNIKQYLTLPFLSSIYFSHTKTSSNSKLQNKFINRLKLKKILPCYNFFVSLYYLSHIPYFIFNSGNYNYYKEEYLLRHFYNIYNLIFNNLINIENIFFKKKLYSYDLRANVQKLKNFY